jgi:colanic acid/amylovoran biosynthesis glycosyltransferase
MKVAFIVTGFPTLSETFILNQITGLLDRGHDVTIYAKIHRNEPVIHADVEKYHLLDRTFYYGNSYQAMPANKFLRLVKTMGLVITNFHTKPILLLKLLYILKFVRKATSPCSLREIATLLSKDIHSYDIFHCHFGPNGNVGALLKDLGVIEGKCITTFYGYDLSMYTSEKGNEVYDSLFKAGDFFLPVSERFKEKLIQLGCEKKRIAVHRLGVDTSRFLFTARKPGEDGKVHILTVARLVEKKGVQYGIQAVAKVLKKHPHVEYKIAGDGPLRSRLQSLIDGLNVNGQIKLLGWKRQEEIVELMRNADILVAPSVTSKDGDQEGIPVVLIEALSQGLPVLSTQHSGIPELVRDGEFGFLVPERDVNALAEKLEYLIEHPERWSKMGQAGRDYVTRYYNIDKLNDQLVNLYQRLLDGGLP